MFSHFPQQSCLDHGSQVYSLWKVTVVQYLPFSSHSLIYRLGLVSIADLTLSSCWILPIPCLSKQGTPVIVDNVAAKAALGTLRVFTLLTSSLFPVLIDQYQRKALLQPRRSMWRGERQSRDVARLWLEQRSSFCLFILFPFALRGSIQLARRL